MPTKIEEIRGRLDEKRSLLERVFEQAGSDYDMGKVTEFGDGLDSQAKVEKIRALNNEMTELGKELDEQTQLASIAGGLDSMADRAGNIRHAPDGVTRKENEETRQEAKRQSLGELFVASDAFKEKGKVSEVQFNLVEYATLFETGAGWAPSVVRGPRVVDLATRPIRVIDLFPQGATTSSAIKYMEETTFTNNAAEVAEGGTKPEAVLALTERTEPVQKIAVWIPVTDEQLEDVPQVRSYLDNRLGFMVRQRLDSQLLVGNGTSPNLSGILDRSGLQTQAKGADPTPDAVYKAMTKVRVNAFAEPNAAVFHPNDWQDVRLLRTADGLYIWGSPADAGPERIWGITVVQTTAITENTALVGDFQQAEVIVRSGVELAISNSHSTYFVENKQAVRAEMRVALAVYRPAAYCSVTGI